MALEEERTMDSTENSGEASGSVVDTLVESPPAPFPNSVPEFPRNSPRRGRFGSMNDEDYVMGDRGSSVGRDDAKSCFFVSVAFSCFAAITLAFGLYSPKVFEVGPNTSILINPNRFLVESIKVEALDISKGLMLYGFEKPPPLNVILSWFEFRNITFPGGTHKEWMYYLNKGSQVNISYSVDSFHSSSLVLAIAEGDQNLAMWLEDPSDPNVAFLWTIIHGNGTKQRDIFESSSYYVAVGNLNNEAVKVYLNTSVNALVYNTKEPYYQCAPAEGKCTFELLLLGRNSVVIETPSSIPGLRRDNWNIKLSYGPRWRSYLVCIGGFTCFLQLINCFLNHCRRNNQSTPVESEPERNPLLLNKDDDLFERSSSSDNEEQHPEDSVTDEGLSIPICAICFDAPKDSFFIPCGHCAACFECATRIAETSAACPICRRRIKRVRRIYTA